MSFSSWKNRTKKQLDYWFPSDRREVFYRAYYRHHRWGRWQWRMSALQYISILLPNIKEWSEKGCRNIALSAWICGFIISGKNGGKFPPRWECKNTEERENCLGFSTKIKSSSCNARLKWKGRTWLLQSRVLLGEPQREWCSLFVLVRPLISAFHLQQDSRFGLVRQPAGLPLFTVTLSVGEGLFLLAEAATPLSVVHSAWRRPLLGNDGWTPARHRQVVGAHRPLLG